MHQPGIIIVDRQHYHLPIHPDPCFRIIMLLMRWSTPAFLVFADTAIFYNLDAACCSFLLAWWRSVYHTHSWASVVIELPRTVRLFNEKVLAPRRGVSLLPRFPAAFAPPPSPCLFASRVQGNAVKNSHKKGRKLTTPNNNFIILWATSIKCCFIIIK